MSIAEILVPLVIAAASGLVGLWLDLTDPDNARARQIGRAALVILLVGLGWEAYIGFSERAEAETLRQFIEQREDIDQPSGGTTCGTIAYVVDDDEKSRVFVYEYKRDKSRFVLARSFALKDTLGKLQTLLGDGKIMVDDLEGAACHNGELYLVTSHANSKGGEDEPARRLFLRVALEGKQEGDVLAATDLRERIRAVMAQPFPPYERLAVDWINKPHGRNEVMNIEGLAIDPQGRAYFGLRNPLGPDERAIVLRCWPGDVLDGGADFEVFALRLGGADEAYGITSLEYDPISKQILLLGNHPRRYEKRESKLWLWSPPDGDGPPLQAPDLRARDFFDPPRHLNAKAEVVLALADEDVVSMFIDCETVGGQRVYRRAELNLPALRQRSTE